MTLYEEILTLPRIKDKIKVEIVEGYGELCWRASRATVWGWEKIPAMTRAEERRFPKAVGYAAQRILQTYKERHP